MHNYKDNFQNAIDFAVSKVSLKWWKLILLGIMGTVYVGIGYIFFILIVTGMQESGTFASDWKDTLINTGVGPKVSLSGWPLFIGASLFPVGLLLIVFLGGSLFTSDNLTSIAIIMRKIKIPPVVLKWALTLLGNIMGSFIIAAISRGGNIFNDECIYVLQQIISKKIHMEWWQAFFSGILCNILVAGTVWATFASKHSIAKIFLIYFPIWLFAVVGFQHVTANSIIFAFGWVNVDNPIMQSIGQNIFADPLSVAEWSFRVVLINMIPAMFGNWLSGAIVLPYTYFWLSGYNKKAKIAKQTKPTNNKYKHSSKEEINEEDLYVTSERDMYNYEEPSPGDLDNYFDEDNYPVDNYVSKTYDDEDDNSNIY